eukprot:jgi/Astpho2/7095/Aster-01924
MLGGAKTVLARTQARQPTRPRKHRTLAQSAAVQEVGNITSATGLARTGSNKFNQLQPLEVRIETLMRQNQELVSMNSALEMRNTVLEKTNAELTTQHRNDVIRIHAIEKEATELARKLAAAVNRILNLENELEEGGVTDIKSMWYSFTDSKNRLQSVEDELEEARYERRRAVAAARQDTERACAEAARQKANADILSIMIMRMVQACKPAEGC